MELVSESIPTLVCDFCERHRQLPEEKTTLRPSASGWTLKEIIGHLIDSASNNHQRITRLQLAPELHFPSYENEKWLAAEKWNLMGWPQILDLFRSYNIFLAHGIRNVDPECLKNRWFGRDRSGERVYSLEDLIADYLKHLKEHLVHFEMQEKEIKN
jgi:hypothetical protein